MKNKFLFLISLTYFFLCQTIFSFSAEEFNFKVTEIDITENGNLVVGSKGGKAITNEGFEIIAENFVYNKLTNILNVSGSVKFTDAKDGTEIYADKATYLKNDEIIFTEGNSKAVSKNNVITAENFKYNKIKNVIDAEDRVKFTDAKDGTEIYADKATYLKNDEIIFTEGNSKAVSKNNVITAENFKYNKIKNVIDAEKNVKIVDISKETTINTEKATYQKNDEIVFTEGNTVAFIEDKYKFKSENVKYTKNRKELYSDKKTSILDDDGNTYELDNFLYQINKKILKGQNVNVFSKADNKSVDNYFFSEGIFDFLNKSFVAKSTKIKVHKEIFENDEQDPRVYGVSSYGDEKETVINKGIFTSCKITNNCPPWSIQSEKITHDKIKKDLIYENAVLKMYDIPIIYFPKFFHPDPTVDRRTGFLKPQFNNSKKLGSSIFTPYFLTIGNDKDYTFKPTIFEDNKTILQNEFRKVTKNSSLITDFSLTRGYESSINEKKKNINHIFLNYKKELNLPNYVSAKLEANLQRVNNDTYLKVFQNNLYSFESAVIPTNKDTMVSNLNFDLQHDDYDFSTNFQIFEELGKKHSDRYQYVLPSYNFSKNLNINNFDGSVSFSSDGSNNLKDTNNLRTSITNDLNLRSRDYFSNTGIKNNFNLYFKNLNSLGKNDPTYKSSPRVEGMGIAEFETSLPLIKRDDTKNEILTPKISLRANPGNNMKDYSTSDRTINADNIFEINRLGLSDSFEAGKSLTMGINYKLDNIEYEPEIENDEVLKDKYLELRLATVFRDKMETEIPKSSTLNKKNSNIYGSINNELYNNLSLNYNFSIDNNFDTFDSHSLDLKFKVNNFLTEFNYQEQKGDIGSNHIISNRISYDFDENNTFSFSTRRNKKINLTEYYNLIYEYKNDCLTAGIKFNKTFYQDNDLVPEENLFFTISLIPLTTYERSLYQRTN